MIMKKEWNKNSWRNFNIKQQPSYNNSNTLKLVEDKINKLPPLIFAGEVRSLKNKLEKVSLGKLFYSKVETVLKVFLTLVQII